MDLFFFRLLSPQYIHISIPVFGLVKLTSFECVPLSRLVEQRLRVDLYYLLYVLEVFKLKQSLFGRYKFVERIIVILHLEVV
jgi:hypothetical protein